MKPLSLLAQCGHPVALDIDDALPVAEVQRRTAIVEAEVCLECWMNLYLMDAAASAQAAGLPDMDAPDERWRVVTGFRARYALFPATAQRIGHLQQHAAPDEWQRLAGVLVALRRETSASRWAAWRWLEPDVLIEAVALEAENVVRPGHPDYFALIPTAENGMRTVQPSGWGPCPPAWGSGRAETPMERSVGKQVAAAWRKRMEGIDE